jgi:HTH-type transcriptional regulator, quorum sensing regulator NprR
VKKVGETMEFGPLIKYFRTQIGLTQRDLAAGICSISHLSKIENNGKDANIETISLLLEKLNIDPAEINEKDEQIKGLLLALNDKILFYQKDEVDQIFHKLSSMEDIIPFSNSLYTYELYKYRYYLFKGNLQAADRQENILNKQKKNFSQHETYLFHYYNAVCLIMKGQYNKADISLEKLSLINNHQFETGELLYHRALAKSALGQSDHAIYFGKKALQSFMNEHNFIRILHTLMLLGINYTHTKIYEEALGCFQHLIRNAELLNETQIMPNVYHNMGFLKAKMGNFQEATVYFEKSLSLQSREDHHYLVTLYSIAEIHYFRNDLALAVEAFERAYLLSKKLDNEKYLLLSNYYLKAMDSYDDSVPFLELKVVPFLEHIKEHPDLLNRFYRLLSNHYRQKGEFEIAVHYIEKIF